MRTKETHTFDLQHDSGDGLHECIELAHLLSHLLPDHEVTWESVKSNFGHLTISSEKRT